MQFSSEDNFEVIKHQMVFNEGLLVCLQSVKLEEKMSSRTLQNGSLVAGPITGCHGTQPSCAATLSEVLNYLSAWVDASVCCCRWSCDFSRQTSNSAVGMVKLFFSCQCQNKYQHVLPGALIDVTKPVC